MSISLHLPSVTINLFLLHMLNLANYLCKIGDLINHSFIILPKKMKTNKRTTEVGISRIYFY